MSIVVTEHAHQRMKERIPGMKSAARREELARKAWELGVRIGKGNSVQNACLIERKAKERIYPEYAGREGVLYHDIMFIFAGASLVTVYQIKPEAAKKCERIRAKQRRTENKRMAA